VLNKFKKIVIIINDSEHITQMEGLTSQMKDESFWSLFLKWLSSPWNVSWKKIKKQSKK